MVFQTNQLQFFNENHVNKIIIQWLNHYDLNTRLLGFFRESLSFIHTNVKREQISNIQNVPIVLRICVHIILIMFLEANFWNFCISWILSPINFFFVLKTLTSSYLLNSINVDNMNNSKDSKHPQLYIWQLMFYIRRNSKTNKNQKWFQYEIQRAKIIYLSSELPQE